MAEKEEVQRIENKEWLESLRWIIENEGSERAKELLSLLHNEAQKEGISISRPFNTPYINTIPRSEEEAYPGDLEIEKKLLGILRWNAMAMVVKANQRSKGIGGHISTYGSIAHLWETGFNHFFKIRDDTPDMVFFQGHASPGIYARAFLEGRISEKQLYNFRRELQEEPGLSSYPHPRLMPDFWKFPTVSMGLGPITAIYQARFNKYLKQRGLIEKNENKVWAFLGDGEMDEPEATGAISLAAQDKLENLIFVVDCNLQRLDGPVRGNGKIIQELEALFGGAGWNVIKVLWGRDWDSIFQNDSDGKIVEKLNKLPDGQLQKYAFADGDYIREDFFGSDEALRKIAGNFTDKQLKRLRRGGHDFVKIFNAFKKAAEHKGQPTIILAQTIKGYGQGEAGEASNVSHKTKDFTEDQLKYFRDRFKVPISDENIAEIPFIKPEEDSKELKYLLERRKKLGGFIPERKDRSPEMKLPEAEIFKEFYEGSDDEEVATTMALVQMLSKLYDHENVGELIVPIIPDESRTFGMESLFRKMGIYAAGGQKYEPVDQDSLLYYKESKDGAIMEEGITEAGSMAEFIAAGTAHLTHGINTVPFYFFYSMFGFQRTGDLMWAAADAGARGFLIGGISGRTSIPGEGLQHQDGNSHLYALAYPTLRAYDPAFAYEIAVILREGLRRMYTEKEELFYYLTVSNDTYPMPPMPEESEDGIVRGMYLFRSGEKDRNDRQAHLFGSGAIMMEVIQAAEILEEEYNVACDVWSITSYKALYDDAIDTERNNRMKAVLNQEPNYIQKCLEGKEGVFVAATDYVKALPESVAQWFPGTLNVLGTDGFGRSEARKELREFFEVDAHHIAFAALYDLCRQGKVEVDDLARAAKSFGIESDKLNPRTN